LQARFPAYHCTVISQTTSVTLQKNVTTRSEPARFPMTLSGSPQACQVPDHPARFPMTLSGSPQACQVPDHPARFPMSKSIEDALNCPPDLAPPPWWPSRPQGQQQAPSIWFLVDVIPDWWPSRRRRQRRTTHASTALLADSDTMICFYTSVVSSQYIIR